MIVGVGTGNPLKFKAVQRVFKKVFPAIPGEYHSYQVPSGVEDQPIGMESVVQGAVNRANIALQEIQKLVLARNDIPPDTPLYGIGIEAGLVRVPHTISGYLDYQYCAITDQKGRLSLGSGPGWEYPPEVIRQITTDRTLEVGTVMGKIAGNENIKYENGAIGYYTDNNLTRGKLTDYAVYTALIPLLNSDVYFS